MESNTSAEIDSTSAELDSTSSTISDVSGGKVETLFSSYVEGLTDVPHVVHRHRGEKIFSPNKFHYDKCNMVISAGEFIIYSVSDELQFVSLGCYASKSSYKTSRGYRHYCVNILNEVPTILRCQVSSFRKMKEHLDVPELYRPLIARYIEL